MKIKSKVISVLLAGVMFVTGNLCSIDNSISKAEAAENIVSVLKTSETGTVDVKEAHYLSGSQYNKLFGADIINTIKVDEFSENDTSHPLEGVKPSVLSELYFG